MAEQCILCGESCDDVYWHVHGYPIGEFCGWGTSHADAAKVTAWLKLCRDAESETPAHD